MKIEDKKHLALAYLTQSIHYLLLSESVFLESVKQGNKYIIISDTEIIDFEEKTKWSDFNIIFPTLFVFYHGLELLMKGVLTLYNIDLKATHRVSVLFTNLEDCEEVDIELSSILKEYILENQLSHTPIGEWLKENNLNIDNLYERLRYPTDKNQLTLTNNQTLKYKGDEMIPFLEKIIANSGLLRKLIVSIYKKNV